MSGTQLQNKHLHDPLAGLLRNLGSDSPFWAPQTPSFPNAECLKEIPDVWFPQSDDGTVTHAEAVKIEAAAVDMCYDCPHMIDCGNYAVENRMEFGVWGGLTEADRETIWAQEDEEAVA